MNNIETIAECIEYMIKERKEENQPPYKCYFWITTPNSTEFEISENIKTIKELLVKNKVSFRNVNTVVGAFNLNREWIETQVIECYIEYCGVYPINWNIEDVVLLQQLEDEGKIMIKVSYLDENDDLIPNN